MRWFGPSTEPTPATIAGAELEGLKASKKAEARKVRDRKLLEAEAGDEWIVVARLRIQLDNIVSALQTPDVTGTNTSALRGSVRSDIQSPIRDITGTQAGDPVYDAREAAFSAVSGGREAVRAAFQTISGEIDALATVPAVEAYDASDANPVWP